MSTPHARRKAEGAYRGRMLALGFRHVKVWVHADDWPVLREIAARMRRKREAPPDEGEQAKG